MNLMTIMYIAIQTTLNDPEDMSMAYGKLRTYETPFGSEAITDSVVSRIEPVTGGLHAYGNIETEVG